MSSALWKSLKATAQQAPTNVVNGDVIVTEETQSGDGSVTRRVVTDTTPGAGERIRFKPVAALDHHMTAKQIADAPPSDNFDLVGDDISAPPDPKPRPLFRGEGSPGRPRVHTSNAEKQAAYRARQKANGKA